MAPLADVQRSSYAAASANGNIRTGSDMEGWVGDDNLPDKGSYVYCGF
ncbi:MAG TPA: hypothetical protein VMB79_07775 [Jatrophihabitans sp.]|nr:hypothetical protein [Jatrophihabitans sp.]